MSSSPTVIAGGGCPQPSGTAGTDAAVAGSIRTTARSRSASVATTSPRTLRVGENCTSTAVAAPTACWFVTTRPAPSTTTPEACASGDQIATTLSCQRAAIDARSSSGTAFAGVGADGGGVTASALAAVSTSDVSRPAATSTD